MTDDLVPPKMSENFVLSDFDQYGNSTKEALVTVGNTLIFITRYTNNLSYLLAIIGIFMNVFHIVILTRKSLISNVVNVVMLGIAVGDIVNLSLLVQKVNGTIDNSLLQSILYECTLPYSSLITRLNTYHLIMMDDFRRLSSWLGFLMASLRYLTIKNPLNPNFHFLSKPSFGWKSLAIALIISTLISMFYLIRVDLTYVDIGYPENCGYPANFSIPLFFYTPNELFISGTSIYKSYIVFDGILKIIPTVLLPVLALLLIRELKKAEKSRKTMLVSSQSANNSDNTSKLVIIMTITCICAEGPLGIGLVIEGLIIDVPKLRQIIFRFVALLFLPVTLNATTHFFVCLGVSTLYRKAVKELLGYKKSLKPIATTPKLIAKMT